MTVRKGLKNIVEPVDEVVSSPLPVDPKLLVAAELFASAKLETTERSRFVGLVSSLEPLATQEIYEKKELDDLIELFGKELKSSQLPDSLKASLIGRVNQLKVESISRAILRLVKEALPSDSSAVTAVQQAYDLRSKILHEGTTDADLELRAREIEEIVRRIFEVRFQQYFNTTTVGNA